MAYNQYINQMESKKLSKKVLNQMIWRSLFLQGSFNYTKLQSSGWLYSILPGLKSIHKNKNDLKLSMTHHMETFNTHPFLVTFVMGIVLALEQKKSDIQTIRSIKIATMSCLGGIGDAIFYFTLLPIAVGIGSELSLSGSFLGPIVFLLIFNSIHFAIRFFLMYWSYNSGLSIVNRITKHTKQLIHSCTILGVLVVGALIATYVKINLSETLTVGGKTVQSILDSVMPNLLSLGLTVGLYSLIKKNVPILVNILLLIVIGLLGAFVGIF